MTPRMSRLSSVASGASVFSIFAALLMLGYQVVLLQLRLGSRKLVVAVGTCWELLTQLRDPPRKGHSCMCFVCTVLLELSD